MKKFLFVLALICAFLIISCEPAVLHEHKWDKGTITTAATCTTKGVRTFRCSCGETKTQEISIAPDNHDLSGGYELIKEPTFLEAGEEKAVCTRCKKEITRKTDRKSLVGTTWYSNFGSNDAYFAFTDDSSMRMITSYYGKEGPNQDVYLFVTDYIIPYILDFPTISFKQGNEQIDLVITQKEDNIVLRTTVPAEIGIGITIDCNLYDGEIPEHSFTKAINLRGYEEGHHLACSLEHSHGDGVKGAILIDMVQHKFDNGEVITEATCVQNGSVKYTCTECGYEKTENTERTEHTVNEWTTVTNSTCLIKGSESGICTTCKDTIYRELALGDHSYDRKVTAEPTLFNEGKYEDTCSVCENIISGNIDRTDINGTSWDLVGLVEEGNNSSNSIKGYAFFIENGHYWFCITNPENNYTLVLDFDGYEFDPIGKTLKVSMDDASLSYKITPTETGFSYVMQEQNDYKNTVYIKKPDSELSISYKANGSEKHIISCIDGGKEISLYSLDMTGTPDILFEGVHEPDENGKCILCGYKQ